MTGKPDIQPKNWPAVLGLALAAGILIGLSVWLGGSAVGLPSTWVGAVSGFVTGVVCVVGVTRRRSRSDRRK
jgi:hypothetical protein